MCKRLLSRFMVGTLVAINCFWQNACADESPANLPGATIVTALEAKRLQDKGVLVVDTRVGNEYAEAHIKGAINIPYKENSKKAPNYDASQDLFDLTRLPAEKERPIIFYCNAGECWKSYKASKAALKAGYRQIYWLRGGLPEWKKTGLPVD